MVGTANRIAVAHAVAAAHRIVAARGSPHSMISPQLTGSSQGMGMPPQRIVLSHRLRSPQTVGSLQRPQRMVSLQPMGSPQRLRSPQRTGRRIVWDRRSSRDRHSTWVAAPIVPPTGRRTAVRGAAAAHMPPEPHGRGSP